MKLFARLFWVLAVFFVVAAVAYSVWSWLYDLQGLATDPSGGEGRSAIEWVGTVALALCGALAALIAFYLRRQYRSQNGERPEDLDDAEIDDGDAEQGELSPWSWWPIVLAGACALTVLGLAIGIWISMIGVGLLLIAVVGWVFEYYRGYFGR